MRPMRKLTDDDFDENGILKDGRSLRVPMMMMDGSARFHDGRGAPVGHRPGFVMTTDAAVRDAKMAAYDEYESEISSAWKQAAPARRPAQEDALPTADERQRVYADYDRAVTDAWRAR